MKTYGPQFIDQFEAIVDGDGSAHDKFAQSLILIFDSALAAESGGDPSQMANAMRQLGMTKSAAILEQRELDDAERYERQP